MALLRPKARLRDVYGFVQGDPFPHCGDILERLEQPIRRFTWWGIPHRSDRVGHPHHPDLEVGRRCAEWGLGEFPGEVEFAAGAQFAITGRQLKKRTPDEYRALYQSVLDTPDGPWVAERLWELMLA